MQFLVPPELLGGGGVSSTPATLPQFAESSEQKRKRELLLKAMQGQGSFENIFGTGPGAVKSVTTKPDGNKTTTYNTPPVEAIPAAQAVEMAQRGSVSGAQPELQNVQYVPSNESTAIANQAMAQGTKPNLGSILSDPGFYGVLGQLGAAIGGKGSFAESLGGVATGLARNQLFDRYLQQRLAGSGGAGGSSPFSVSGLGVGLLSPQEQLAAQNQPLEELKTLSDASYKEALASGVETPEQMLQRQVLIEMLGQKQAQPNAGSFQNIERGPDGKRTPGITHKWLIDDVTGNPIKYQGVVGATNPQQSGAGNADDTRQWYQKAVDEAKRNVDREASQYGKIQTDAFGNIVGIEWSDEGAPQRYQQSYYRHLTKAIKRFQTLGNLPAGFEKPFESELAPQQVSKPKSSLLK